LTPEHTNGVSTNGVVTKSEDVFVSQGDHGGRQAEEFASSSAVSPAQDDPKSRITSAYVNGTSLTLVNSSDPDVSIQPQGQKDDGSATTDKTSTRTNMNMNGHHQVAATSGASSAPASRPFTALPSLSNYLVLLNTSKEGADILFEVNANNAQSFMTYCHSIILFRSLRMRKLVTRLQQANSYNNVITLYPVRYVMPHAFEAALRYLYSDATLVKDFFAQPIQGPDYQVARIQNLDYIISYWTAGIELGLEPVSACAERLLGSYLDWDVLEITYKYATELAWPSAHANSNKDLTGSDYLAASGSAFKQILQFLAYHMDIKNFKLDASCNSSLIPSRLPQLDDGRPKKHNPALASMVFGSMPSSADMSPTSSQIAEVYESPATFREVVASSILLNVDFENLCAFNNFIHRPAVEAPAATSLMVSIVNEREARRQKMLESRVPNKERVANSAAWDVVGLKESILETNVLHQVRVGYLSDSPK
jgi:hypothetical protein